MLTKNILAFHN